MQKAAVLTILPILGLLAIATGASAAAPLSQDWYLDEANHGTVAGAKIMFRGDSPTPSGADTVSIPAGTCQLWAADEAAAQTVTFPKDDWSGGLIVNDNTAKYNGFKYPSSFGDNLGLQSTGKSTFIANGPTHDIGVVKASDPTTGGSFTIVAGKYLVFKLCNPSTSGKTLVLQTDGSSYVSSPSHADAYPLPELSTMVLSLAGIGVVGAVVMRRKA